MIQSFHLKIPPSDSLYDWEMADERMLRPPADSDDEQPGKKTKTPRPRHVVDGLPNKLNFTLLDILFIVLSIGSYLLDTGTDLALAYFYYNRGYQWYFGLTLTFVVVPAITMTIISLYWYVEDQQKPGHPPVSVGRWLIRAVFLLFQLGPVLRYIDSIAFGWKSRQSDQDRRKYYMLMVYEDADATLLRLFECFMEAAPQLVLQLHILARNPEILGNPNEPGVSQLVSEDGTIINSSKLVAAFDDDVGESSLVTISFQAASVLASLVSVSWALASYHRALRYSLQNKQNISLIGLALYFLWRLGTVGARVLALALFASLFPSWIAVVCGIRWLIMSAWVLMKKTDVCSNRCAEICFDFIVGFIYIFCFFNVKDEPTRYKYITYYLWEFSENTALIVTWFIYADPNIWFYYPAIVGHYCAFFLGLAFMLIYYSNFHPSGKMKMPWSTPTPTEVNQRDWHDSNQQNVLRRSSKHLGRLNSLHIICEMPESKV